MGKVMVNRKGNSNIFGGSGKEEKKRKKGKEREKSEMRNVTNPAV